MTNFKFGDLRGGARFTFIDYDELYIKKQLFGFIPSSLDNSSLSSFFATQFNAVNLETGDFVLVDDTALVVPVD